MYERPRDQLGANRLRAMGVWLPAPARNPSLERVRQSYFMGVTFSWRDVSADLPDEAAIAAQFVGVNCEATLALLYLVSRVLSDTRGTGAERDAQRDLAHWLLPAAVAGDAAARLVAEGNFHRDFIFHHEQLLAAAALALVHAGDGPPGVPSEAERHQVGTLLLQLSGHLSTDEGVDAVSDQMLGHTARGLYLGFAEALPEVAARYYEFFGERLPKAHGDGHLAIDATSDFKVAYGVDPVTFMALGVLAVVPWVDVARLNAVVGSFWQAGRTLAAQLDNLGLRNAADALVMADRAWYRERLQMTPLRAANYLPLYERPFLRLSDGGVMPMNWRLVTERAFSGVYWALHGLYRSRGGEKAIQSWIGELGRSVYEPYVHDRLSSAYSRRDPSDAEYLTEDAVGQYRSSHGDLVAGADGYLREGSALVIIEVTASGIPASTLLSGDGSRLRAAIDRLLIGRKGKLRQLDRVVGDLLHQRLAVPRADLDHIETIIPLLITASPFPQFPSIWYHVRQAWQEQGLFAFGGKVAAPQLINLEELEMIEAALEGGEATLSGLLLDRQANYEGGSLKNFLIATNRSALLRRSVRTGEGFRRFREAIDERLIAAGLPEAPGGETTQ
jgi:hypothetical protein